MCLARGSKKRTCDSDESDLGEPLFHLNDQLTSSRTDYSTHLVIQFHLFCHQGCVIIFWVFYKNLNLGSGSIRIRKVLLFYTCEKQHEI